MITITAYAKTHSRAAGAKPRRRKVPQHPDVTELRFPSVKAQRMAAKLAAVAETLLAAVAAAADGASPEGGDAEHGRTRAPAD